jgi:hypothetical protein
MGYNQDAYDAECAALARALETAARRETTPEKVTIFTDAQAAIRQMASEDPGGPDVHDPGKETYRGATKSPTGINIEIWWSAHEGAPGNEKADEWAKLAAEEPDARGVEWLMGEARPMPLPRSLAHLKREISEKKWAEARQWAGGRITSKKYKMPCKQRTDKTVAGSSKRHASRFYQLKTGHCLTGQYLNWTKSRPHRSVLVVFVQDTNAGAPLQGELGMEGQQKIL